MSKEKEAMTDEQLAEIRRVVNAATEGDWYETTGNAVVVGHGFRVVEVADVYTHKDAELIANAKEYICNLLDYVSQLRSEVIRQKELCHAMKAQYFYRRVRQEGLACDNDTANAIAVQLASGVSDNDFLSGVDVENPSLRALNMRRCARVPNKIKMLPSDCSIEDTIPDSKDIL